jgi:hypothetical protein
VFHALHVASRECSQERASVRVGFPRARQDGPARWNRFEHARVLGDEGATERERANHQEESAMSRAIARFQFAETPRANARNSSNDAAHGAVSAPLTRTQIGGRLSLVDRGPLAIAAEHGLVVRIRTGSVWTSQPGDGQYWLVRTGEGFTAHRAGPLVVRAVERSEIEIVWPRLDAERLSPGLEPVSIVP